MNCVIMNIVLIRYILNSKYIVISVDLITRFRKLHYHEYWTYKIYFEFYKFNHVVQ